MGHNKTNTFERYQAHDYMIMQRMQKKKKDKLKFRMAEMKCQEIQARSDEGMN